MTARAAEPRRAARLAGLAAIVALGAGLAPPAEGGDAQAGRTKARACATCHGADGISRMPATPHLAGQPAEYLAAQLRAFRSGRRAHAVMGVVARPLSDADIADLAAWYASIELRATLPQP